MKLTLAPVASVYEKSSSPRNVNRERPFTTKFLLHGPIYHAFDTVDCSL